MNTLLLDTQTWDLVADAAGNIACAAAPYAQAQDVASAVRTFSGELQYDTRRGIPYFEQVLGQRPPLQLVKGLIEREASTVPGIVTARCSFSSLAGRTLSGRIETINSEGVQNNVEF